MREPTGPSSDQVAKLRGAIAEVDATKYKLAAKARVHPSKLSAVLHGREPLTADLAQRLFDALATMGGAGR